MAKGKKCAHEPCECLARESARYCSSACEAAAEESSSRCSCGHDGCSASERTSRHPSARG